MPNVQVDATRFVKATAWGDPISWSSSGSGSAASGFSFTIPSYAVAGQYAIIYMAMKNGEMSGNPIDSNIVRISGISASYAGLSQNSPSIGISRKIPGSTPSTYQSVYMQFAIIYIQQSNIGNTYSGSNTGSQTYENGSEYAYGLIGVNENHFSPNYYSEFANFGSGGTYSGGPGYPTMSIPSYSYYPANYDPTLMITCTAGYGSSVGALNLINESWLSIGYQLLTGGASTAQSFTVSQPVALAASHTFSPVVTF